MEHEFHTQPVTSSNTTGGAPPAATSAAAGSRPAAAGTQVIDRAAQLLVLVLDGERPRGVGELARDAQLPKSTASRLLSALERHGLVEQEAPRGPFRAGPVLLRYAHRGLVARNLVELSQQPMHALAEATGETVNLAVAGPSGVEHLDQVDSRHFLGTGQWVGRHVAYHCSANGKVLLAFGAAELPAGEALEPLTSRTVVDRARLQAELERIRRERFATAIDELETGLTALAAPVFDASGAAIAALSVCGPTLRLPPRQVAELRPVVIKQARALSERLGHRQEGVHAA
jgi:DNA-binding IclR family transcriptional regulator